MKTLIIDNYDSFTYNLADLIADINQCAPRVVKNDAARWDEIAAEPFDNIVISPGPGRPDRAQDFGLSRDALAQATVPVLGVCLGFQGLAMAAGGRLAYAPSLVHGEASMVRHNGHPLFAGVPSPFAAGRYHSFMIERPLPPDLEEIAWSDDGVLMALAHRMKLQCGVQFHPESILTEHGRRLLENFRDLSCGRVSARESVTRPRRNIVPSAMRKAFWRELPYAVETEAAFCHLYAASPYAFWLDSSLVAPGLSRWSYLGNAAGQGEIVEYNCADGFVSVVRGDASERFNGSIFDYLKAQPLAAPQTPPPCPLIGGYVGWFGYELQQDCGSRVHRTAATPDSLLIRADRFIAVDHVEGKTYLVAVDDPAEEARARRWLDAMEAALTHLPPPPSVAPRGSKPLEFVMAQGERAYRTSVEACLSEIRNGESYQVCLTNELSCEADLDPLDVYRVMRKINPAPFAAYLRWPGGAVLSASPERFLSGNQNGEVETKPIKGTVRRDSDPRRDRELREALRASRKDRAENAMIVDLLRNDFSRCCVPGSVRVTKLFGVESYETVHQLVTTVRGQLQPECSTIDLLQAAFPGGSMTGAPKLRTLEIIDRLEGRARGIYSGALGWIGADGAADLSIVIRTIVAQEGHFTIGAGGGVVAASTPEAEYAEMLLKAQASIKALVTTAFGRFDDDLYQLSDRVSAQLKERAS
ncbi:para-aminobenzoate synthase [Afipia carboxidovorans OM5]|uniref:aminodeoxychorismate synthase n=1 Tax=Afipia carboxidovorans (strain ATCC 49405 / DSM 1227 / KCTC 32145 / OM5) TaxID=504832 RepID=B6JCD3_AFIC5|nr:aminodeoxychorismate synthase component I [Afipia carboxidovorans]ACI92349.1 para-aminobenzoate synthase [Afipia carboxidovorans OM5]AEI03868.1 para-aminobenzoate synthase PabB [Afipia carboxidovorans OM4]AEI07445.1 para-aminobenzoate synthase PabB [Afipia carboxidovorans OM5]